MNGVAASQTDWPPREFGWPRPTDRGRVTELGIIRSLLDDVAAGGGALVVSGEQGIGKTTLLDGAQRAAEVMGMRVVRVDGAEFESIIDLAGLHQLLIPLAAEVNELPQRTRCAIEAVLNLGSDCTANRLVFLNAVFALLRQAAERIPTLLIVDDVQWFDEASAEVLAFVARRIGGSHLGLLAATRVGSHCLLERVGLPEMRLRPLVSKETAIGRRPILTLTQCGDSVITNGREPFLGNHDGTIAPVAGPTASGRRPLVTNRSRRLPQRSTDSRNVDPMLRAATAKAVELLYGDGQVNAAHFRLMAAIDSSWHRTEQDIPGLVQALNTLSEVCCFADRPDLWDQLHETLNLVGDVAPPVLRLVARICPDPSAVSKADLLEVDHHLDRLRAGELDPALTVQIGMAAQFVDRLPGCRNALRRISLGARPGEMNNDAVRAGLLLAVDAYDSGQWADAETLAGECIALCETSGRQLLVCSGRAVLALVAAGRGQGDVCEALTKEIEEWADPRGARRLLQDARRARCLAALGGGDPDEALCDASARTAWISPCFALQAATAEALVASDDLAADLFQAALDIPGIGQWPFEVARLQLAFGERLRRQRAIRASRRQLAAALEAFTRIGARPWAERAGAELRATGQTRHRPDGTSAAPLTPQELGIAELAATGLTNKEIGTKMFLSPRTVSAHLYRVFPKLGITSRAALRDALMAMPSSHAPWPSAPTSEGTP